MASIESERNEEVVGQLSSEQKARLDEVMKQAALSLQSDELLNKAAAGKLQAGNYYFYVQGDLYNYTKGPLTTTTDVQQQYSGSVLIDYTNPLKPSSNNKAGTGSFTMAGDGSVEAAVVYFGKNDKGDQDCAWLIGFNINTTTKPEKLQVYVFCGPLINSVINFINPNWAEIKTKIERGGQVGFYKDDQTVTNVYAGVAATDPSMPGSDSVGYLTAGGCSTGTISSPADRKTGKKKKEKCNFEKQSVLACNV
uniref:Uncharacterized protein n=1 Tax=Oryza sativa subsp. japonica TaxID=39947 RepID=Q2R0X6_ORYSJ|nr:hypothetical protein LOC_Os11g41070 [Oryza sativa Japonica Group]